MADDSSTPPGNKPAAKNRNTTMYILLVCVGVMLIYYWTVNTSLIKITPRHFELLVQQSGRVSDGGPLVQGAKGILQEVGSGESTQSLRLTSLRKVQVYEKVIMGIVDQRVEMGKGVGEESVEKRIRVNRGSSDGRADEALKNLLNEHNIEWDIAHESGLARIWPFLLISGLVLIFFVIMLRRLGGAGSPAQFGRSRGRLCAQEDLGVTFNDVAGIDEALEEVWEVDRKSVV
jgi:cell division protease FtsH